MNNYNVWMDEQIRLIILKELAATTPDPTLTSFILVKVLESHSYKRTTEYVRNQLLWLDKQAGAVRTSMMGTEMAGTLTKAGRWHVERRHLLSGIQNPSDID